MNVVRPQRRAELSTSGTKQSGSKVHGLDYCNYIVDDTEPLSMKQYGGGRERRDKLNQYRPNVNTDCFEKAVTFNCYRSAAVALYIASNNS